MLFALFQQAMQVADEIGPLSVLYPPANPAQARDDETYVLFQDAPLTYKGYQVQFANHIPGVKLPRLLTPEAWRGVAALPGRTCQVVLTNGFGAGYGDMLVGSVVVELVHQRITA